MIHVVGNAAIDTAIDVERFPNPGETIVALGVREDIGGKGANQAVTVARCGERARLVAALGVDAAGARIRAALAAEGVATDGLTEWPGLTDRCIVLVDARGENMIVSLIGAALAFDPLAGAGFEGAVAPGDVVLMQGNLRPETTRRCLARARTLGATTALNPSPAYPTSEYDWSLVDLAIVNRSEAIALGEEPEPLAAARALRTAGAGAVAVTLGADGAALIADSGDFEASAPRVRSVDTVGAGDVFAGTLIAARAQGRAWDEALRIAVAAASLSVTRRGAQASFPSRDELARLLSPHIATELTT